jgi:hypothetical protein
MHPPCRTLCPGSPNQKNCKTSQQITCVLELSQSTSGLGRLDLAILASFVSLTRLYIPMCVLTELNELLASQLNSAHLAQTRLTRKVETRLDSLCVEFESRRVVMFGSRVSSFHFKPRQQATIGEGMNHLQHHHCHGCIAHKRPHH